MLVRICSEMMEHYWAPCSPIERLGLMSNTEALKCRFKVPYNYDLEGFRNLLIPGYKKYIHSIYMGPPAALGSSARPLSRAIKIEDVVEAIELASKAGISSYLTLNGEFIPISTYTELYASKVASCLKMLSLAGLTGIIVSNMYLPALAELKIHAPKLKVIASVNLGVKSVAQAEALVSICGVDGIIWDRSLNVDPVVLAEYNAALKQRYPEVLTQVLLNEGCLLHCPFKKAHDQAISALSYVDDSYYDYLQGVSLKNPMMCTQAGSINVTHGCHVAAKRNPDLLSTIPDIDPCALKNYLDSADVFKISGRTHSTSWIMECLGDYVEGTTKLNPKYSDSGLANLKIQERVNQCT